MALADNFSFRSDEAKSRNSRNVINFGRFCEKSSGCPDIIGLRPALYLKMTFRLLPLIVDAESDQLDLVSPMRIGVPVVLHFLHRVLTRAAPDCPEIDEDNFAAEIGKLLQLVGFEMGKLNIGSSLTDLRPQCKDIFLPGSDRSESF